MGVRSYEAREDPRPLRRGPSVGATVLLAVLVLAGLLANGRPIGGGGVTPLDSAFDEVEAALVGKILASIAAAAAAGFLFQAIGRRRPSNDARAAALLLAFGTTVWASAQSFSVTPFSTALVACAVLLLVLAEDDPAWGPRAGLPLALAAAVNPTALVLALVLALSAVVRRLRQVGLWALWSAPGVVLVLASAFAGPSWGSTWDEAWAPRLAALLVAPAAGLLVFAPIVLVALVGLARALRGADAALAAGCASAFLAHGLFIAGRPLRGGTWGPMDWTDALPLVILFLPEGLDQMRAAGAGLAFLSVAVQVLGAFSHDGRWDRLFAPTPEKRAAVLWDAPRSPIPFQLGERVWIASLPRLRQGTVRIAEHRVVLGAPSGSRLSAAASVLRVEGSDPTLGSVHLLGGARVQGDRIRLESPGDAVFLRIRAESRLRRLEIRIAGRGQGVLAVQEASFWSAAPRVKERPIAGEFRIEIPYHYPESGGGDIRVSLRSGSAALAFVSLVPPTEPENVIRLQGSPDP
ncbi:MAG TPA: hypothetical protein VI669_04645 [Vicinamibacteria bacterium]